MCTQSAYSHPPYHVMILTSGDSAKPTELNHFAMCIIRYLDKAYEFRLTISD